MPPRTCPNCQSLVKPGDTYCEYCGLRLPADGTLTPCPACGTLNLPGELFCQACGVVLAPVSGQPPPLPRQLDRQEHPPKHTEAQKAGHTQQTINNGAQSTQVETIPGCLRQRETGRVLSFPANKAPLLIGRADIALGFFPDIDLEPLGGEQLGVSRQHALLIIQASQTYLEDLNSTNFTFVNHQLLAPRQPTRLNDRDLVQFGQLVLMYELKP
jgi:hypothetical protein